MGNDESRSCGQRLTWFLVGAGGLPMAGWLFCFAAGLVGEYGLVAGALSVDPAAPPRGPVFVRLVGTPRGSFPTVPGSPHPALHATWVKEQRNECVQDVKERQANGSYRYVRKNVVSWQAVDSSRVGPDVATIGAVTVRLAGPAPRWEAPAETVRSYVEAPPGSDPSPGRSGRTLRERTTIIRADAPVVVVGWLEGGRVAGRQGSPFLVAGIPEDELLQRLGTEGTVRIWGIRILGFLCAWAGFAWLHDLVPRTPPSGRALLFWAAAASAGSAAGFGAGQSLGVGILAAAAVTSLVWRFLSGPH